MLIRVLTIMTCVGFSVLTACGAEKYNKRTKSKSLPASYQPIDVPNASDDATASEDPADLPVYMLKRADAELVASQIVLPFEAMPSAENAVSPLSTSFEIFRTFVEDYLNSVMKIPALDPGRVFRVYTINDDAMNAYADGYQRIKINRGAITLLTQKQMLAILCHEMTHSGRNHDVKTNELADSIFGTDTTPVPEFDEISKSIDSYLNAQFNPSTLVYHHDLAKYNDIRKKFDEYVTNFVNSSKFFESEADVGGAMTCAKLGMQPKDFAAALVGALNTAEASNQASVNPNDLKDGDELHFDTLAQANSLLSNYLFPMSSHPSSAERDSQINRLMDIIEVQLDVSATNYQQWIDGSVAFLKPDPTSTALVSEDTRYAGASVITRISSNKNEKIYVPKPLPGERRIDVDLGR